MFISYQLSILNNGIHYYPQQRDIVSTDSYSDYFIKATTDHSFFSSLAVVQTGNLTNLLAFLLRFEPCNHYTSSQSIFLPSFLCLSVIPNFYMVAKWVLFISQYFTVGLCYVMEAPALP